MAPNAPYCIGRMNACPGVLGGTTKSSALKQLHAGESQLRDQSGHEACVMAENASLLQILPQLGILLVMGIVFVLIARWRFRLN